MAIETSGTAQGPGPWFSSTSPHPVDDDLQLVVTGLDPEDPVLHLSDPKLGVSELTFPHARAELADVDTSIIDLRRNLPEAALPQAQPLQLAPTDDDRARRPSLTDYLQSRRAAQADPRVIDPPPAGPSSLTQAAPEQAALEHGFLEHGPLVQLPLIPSQPDPTGHQARSHEEPPATIGALHDKHVLLVGINYAPEPTGIAPYTTGMAEHLARQAAGVEVLTGLPHYPNWRVDERYRGLRRTREPRRSDAAPDVTRVWHYVPATQTALTRATYEMTFLASALAYRPRQRPDVVVAVTPSLGGAVAGARIAERHGAKLVVVVQDLMAKAAGQSGISGGGAVAGITGRLEGYALRRADQVVIVSESFRPAVRAYGVDDARIVVLPNWTHITPSRVTQAEARKSLGWPADRFVVAHTGNMGLKQDLGNVVEAARLLPDDVDLLLIGDGSQRQALEEQAAGIINLRFVDPLDDVQYPLALAAADVLLVNERPSVGDMSLPSKLTSYLSAGRAILAAVASDGATAAELARTQGAGLVVRPGDPELLADAITALFADEPLRTAMGQAGWRYANSRLGQAAAMHTLDDVMNTIVDDDSPATEATVVDLTDARSRKRESRWSASGMQ